MNPELHPTYVPFLDKLLGGGIAPTGVYAIIGPTGIGKTHIASMIATDGAMKGSYFHPEATSTKPWILFDIETQIDQCLNRIISHVAKIKRNNVRNRNDEIQDYEFQCQAKLQKIGGKIETEEHRLENAIKVINKQVHLICSDHIYKKDSNNSQRIINDFPAWITEQIKFFNKQILLDQPTLGGIVIDSVSNVWNLSCEFTKLKERVFIQDFVDNYCRNLSNTYQCPVWITHQVNGAACDESPLKKLSHSDAARCKTFANNLDGCFVFGTCSAENIFSIQCTKE